MYTKSSFIPSRIIRSGLLICAIVGSSTAFANTVYTSQAAFDVAVSDRTNYAIPDTAFPEMTTYVDGPLTFSTPGNRGGIFFVDDGDFGAPQPYIGTMDSSLNISFPEATSIGIVLGTNDGDGQLDIVVDGVTYTESYLKETKSFFGITTIAPITSLFIKQTPAYMSEYDVFSIELAGTPSPVPEPSTFVLLGSGILGLAGVVRRKFILP